VNTEIGDYGAPLDLKVRQGADFRFTATIDVDLTGSVLRAQMRKRGLDATLVLTFTIVVTDAVNGAFEVTLTKAQTAALTCGETPDETASRYVWDLELEDALGRDTPLAYGVVRVLREVTR